MRPLECLMLAAVAAALALGVFPAADRLRWARYAPWAVAALALLHILAEGYRWQMIPAYLAAVMVWLPKAQGRAARVTEAAVGAFALGTSLWLGMEVPVFRDPAPGGPYAVGTARLYFVDYSRKDPLAPDPRAQRELMVAVWYPAELGPGDRPERFWPDAPVSGAEMARYFNAPPVNLLGHLRLVATHSYPRAPVARAHARYPVLIFSHGYGGTPWQNTVQMEALASRGFMVFSVGHTYESAAIQFPGGRTEPMNAGEMRKILASPDRIGERLDTWVADIAFVASALAAVNAGDARGGGDGWRFSARLDLERLGVFGMSFGGAAAGEFCAHDTRCKAGMNLDGKQHGTVAEHPLEAPFLYFSHEDNHDNDSIYARSRGDLYSVRVRRSEHANFLDANLVVPALRRLGIMGDVDPEEMEDILTSYTVEFFEKYLQGKASVLLDGTAPPKHPDVVFTARTASSAPR